MVAIAEDFAHRLSQAISRSGSQLCLGLDPDATDAAGAERECRALLDATLEFVCAVKPNVAFFEQYGSAGYAVLERLREAVPADRMLIIDAKRGDIGTTAAAYARALFDVLGADAITVNPVMGADSVAPFLDRPGRGVFLLARTSNPGATDFLDFPAEAPLYTRIVDVAATWNGGSGTIGFVVGATAPHAIAEVRRRAPFAPLLLPGVGAQGGSLESAVATGRDRDGAGFVVPVSRGLSSAPEGPGSAARSFRDRIAAAVSGY